jgi:hypothetical protein
MARAFLLFWLGASMCCLTACSPSQQERADTAADRAAVGARTAMRGLTYEEVEGSVDCAEDCSGHNAGFAYAQEHDIEDDTGCKSGSASYVEGCEAYGQQIEQCVNAAREAVMQGRPPADRCPLLQSPVRRATVQQTDR